MVTQKFVTKRPHKKSRAGCQTCKTRKVKCDEAQPICTFCAQRKLECSYERIIKSAPESPQEITQDFNQLVLSSKSWSPQNDVDMWDVSAWPESSPSPEIMPILSPMSSTDLKVMHHWSTSAWKTIGIGSPGMASVFERVLPTLAFDNEFLMNGMLGISSLHMQRLLPDPTQARKQTDIYRAKSFSSFRQALSKLKPESESYEAAVLMALILVILCSADYSDNGELTVVNWLILYRGLSSVMQMRTYPYVLGTSIAPVFRRQLRDLETPPVIPTILMDMMASMSPTESDFGGFEIYCKTLDTIAILFTALREEGATPALFVRIVSWASFQGDEFLALAKQRQPRAMIILAYYLSFLKLIRGVWWIEGIPDPEIYAISKMLGPEWQIYLDVPLQVREMSNVDDIVNLLLRRRGDFPLESSFDSESASHEIRCGIPNDDLQGNNY